MSQFLSVWNLGVTSWVVLAQGHSCLESLELMAWAAVIWGSRIHFQGSSLSSSGPSSLSCEPLHGCPRDMAAGFPQSEWSKRRRKLKMGATVSSITWSSIWHTIISAISIGQTDQLWCHGGGDSLSFSYIVGTIATRCYHSSSHPTPHMTTSSRRKKWPCVG